MLWGRRQPAKGISRCLLLRPWVSHLPSLSPPFRTTQQATSQGPKASAAGGVVRAGQCLHSLGMCLLPPVLGGNRAGPLLDSFPARPAGLSASFLGWPHCFREPLLAAALGAFHLTPSLHRYKPDPAGAAHWCQALGPEPGSCCPPQLCV